MSEQKFLIGKIESLIRRASRGDWMNSSSFLAPEEGALAESICQKSSVSYLLYGGYEEAERKVLIVSDADAETLKCAAPIVLLQIQCGDLSAISNRDVLGALMGSGIRRDVLGDIIVRDGVALVFVLDRIKDFIIQNVTSIGRQGVRFLEISSDFEIPAPSFEEIRLTVASLRLDAVVGALAHLSREKAAQLIEEKIVLLNNKTVIKKTKEISKGDRIVVRGSGKWIIDECGDLTKKDRVIVRCRKYI